MRVQAGRTYLAARNQGKCVHCHRNSLKGSGFETLEFSADRKLALGHGGWQSGPLSGGWGYCYYEKVGEAWRTLACVITGVS